MTADNEHLPPQLDLLPFPPLPHSSAHTQPPTNAIHHSNVHQRSVSLRAHYLPQKFNSSMLSPHLRRRKSNAPRVHKMGGGVKAFKSGEARMPGEGNEDYDGWEEELDKFKWAMVIANAWLSSYALTTELILSTIAYSLALLTSTLRWAHILLNNHIFLVVYVLLFWVVIALVAAPGYIMYKKRTFNLDGKINAQ